MHKATRYAVLCLLLVLLTTAVSLSGVCAQGTDGNAPDSITSAGNSSPLAPATGYSYIVRRADTLWDIAVTHGITVKALLDANKLADPGMLRPGQKLWVPAPPPVDPGAKEQETVAAGPESGAAPGTPDTASPAPAPGLDDPVLPAGKESWPSDMLALINSSRAAAGVPALAWSPELFRAAQAHAEDCASRNRGGHIGSDGAALATRLKRLGAEWPWATENWAYSQSVGNAFALWWNETPGVGPHRRNILDPKYSYVGIGVANGAWGTYFVADFGGE